MKRNNETEISEIVIPKGYDINEYLDMNDDEFVDKQPIYIQEVKIRFE